MGFSLPTGVGNPQGKIFAHSGGKALFHPGQIDNYDDEIAQMFESVLDDIPSKMPN